MLTTAQFAKLHGVNKRTLHYYDTIGLFSPSKKGDNGYRYYDIKQSIDFEYILMLKELHMSIEEIKAYLQNPNTKDFLSIAKTKTQELDLQILKLKKTKEILQAKKEQIEFCMTNYDKIEIMDCKEERYLITPYDFKENDVSLLFEHVKDTWGIEQIRKGIGSYIAVDKIYCQDFKTYDGLFTPALKTDKEDIMIRPKGRYLCGYQKGDWDMLPNLYNKLVVYAKEHNLKLIGNAYEIGLNDFVITSDKEYITKIMIQIDNLWRKQDEL